MPNSASNSSSIMSARGGVGLDDLQRRHDVLLDIQAAEHAGFLRQIADAQAGAAIHRQARDVGAVQADLPGVGPHQADDHIERGGLAGAVRAQQPDGLTALERDGDIPHHRPSLIGLADAARGQALDVVARFGRRVPHRLLDVVRGIRSAHDVHRFRSVDDVHGVLSRPARQACRPSGEPPGRPSDRLAARRRRGRPQGRVIRQPFVALVVRHDQTLHPAGVVAAISVAMPVFMFTSASAPFNWFWPRVICTLPPRRAMPVSGT